MQYCKVFVALFLVFSGNALRGQDLNYVYFLFNEPQVLEINNDTIDSLGGVHIVQDERIGELLRTDSVINSKNPGFMGYRIQIFLGGSTERKRAFEVKEQFQKLFPSERAYVVYTAPDFRVKVGNFRDKRESINLYRACLKHFPNCYPVKTKILYSDIKPLAAEEQEDELIINEAVE